MDDAPALVACSHGTRDIAGRRVVDDLRSAVAAARPGLRIVEAYVDVQQPELSDVLSDVGAAVVVPVLLSSGYHVHVDIAAAIAATGPEVRMTAALGPDPALVDVLEERLGAAVVSCEFLGPESGNRCGAHGERPDRADRPSGCCGIRLRW